MGSNSESRSGVRAAEGGGEVDDNLWTSADTEDVRCCLCQREGRVLYRRPPFAVVQCPVCALVFVSPRLTSQALQRLYDEPGYFEGGVYGAQSRWSPAMVLQRAWTAGRLAAISAKLPGGEPYRRTPRTMMEIGSGYGHFLAAARAAGFVVSGVELSRTGAGFARDTLGLDVFCGQLQEAPVPPTGADVVCFWDTLEHVPDPLAFLGQVRAHLSPDGVFALSVPYFSSLPARLLGAHWWTLKPEQHIWHYTPSTLQVLAARAGLVVTSVVTSPLARSNLTRTDSLVAIGRVLPIAGERAADPAARSMTLDDAARGTP